MMKNICSFRPKIYRRFGSSTSSKAAFVGDVLPVTSEEQSEEINARTKDRSITRAASLALRDKDGGSMFAKKCGSGESDPAKDLKYINQCQAAYRKLRVHSRKE